MAEPIEEFAVGLAEGLSQPAQLLGWRTLRGASGKRYAFAVLDADGDLPQSGGVFCLVNRTVHANGLCRTDLLRIGQTGNLATKVEALRGAGHTPFNALCVYLEENEFLRRLILREVADGMVLNLLDTAHSRHSLRQNARI